VDVHLLLNNVYCCYLPAHCSHGLQPLDNGVFNASKAAYRKELEKLAVLTDSAPVDKVNFIRCYAKAREIGMTQKNILSGWKVTGNWPISRRKALMHPEIQADRDNVTPEPPIAPESEKDSEKTPTTSRQVRDFGQNCSPSTRRKFSIIAKGFEAQEMTIAVQNAKIASLEEELARLKRGNKRKAIPNPNRRFIQVAEALAVGGEIPEIGEAQPQVLVEESSTDEEDEILVARESEDSEEDSAPPVRTRSGRIVKKVRKY